jgi:hypothetical protein
MGILGRGEFHSNGLSPCLLYRGDTFFDFSCTLSRKPEQQIDSHLLPGMPCFL